MRKLIILIFFLLLTACQNTVDKNLIQGTVNKVISGQTIEVFINNSLVKVRLKGINSPSLKQTPWGKDAKEKLKDLLTKNKSILLETNLTKKDRYDRLQAYIWLEDRLINEKLVEEGYVLADLSHFNDQYTTKLTYAQEYARIMGYGIWNPLRPMPLSPQEFLKNNHTTNN